MQGAQTISTPRTSLAVPAAYAAAVLFAFHLFSYFVPAWRDATVETAVVPAVVLAVLALAQHLVVFPVVPALPAPRVAQIAAYVWLVVDMATDLAQLAGAPKSSYLVVRLAVNLLAAAWIASASWREHGALRGIGIFVALDLLAYSAFGLLSPAAFLITLPSLVLLPVWFLLVGRLLSRRTGAKAPVTPGEGQAL